MPYVGHIKGSSDWSGDSAICLQSVVPIVQSCTKAVSICPLRHVSTHSLASRLLSMIASPNRRSISSSTCAALIGRHESAQSLGVLGLISVILDDTFQVHSLHSREPALQQLGGEEPSSKP